MRQVKDSQDQWTNSHVRTLFLPRGSFAFFKSQPPSSSNIKGTVPHFGNVLPGLELKVHIAVVSAL